MSIDEGTGNSATQGTPFYLRKTFLAAVVFLIGVGIAAVYLALPQSQGNTSASQPPAHEAPTTPHADGDLSEDTGHGEGDLIPDDVELSQVSQCGLVAGDGLVPERISHEVIEVGRGLTVPSVAGAGPGLTDGIPRCFAPNPTGAILAAAHWITWSSSQQQLPEVAEQFLFDDPTGQAAVQEITQSWDGQTWSPVTIVGFSYDDLGENQALVTIAASSIQRPDVIVAFPLPLIFHDGDWKVLAPPSGSFGERVVGDLVTEGFTQWRP